MSDIRQELAFPSHGTMGEIVEEGMTLRDYFAAKAMQGLLASWGEHDISEFSEVSHDAYALADAMMEARNK